MIDHGHRRFGRPDSPGVRASNVVPRQDEVEGAEDRPRRRPAPARHRLRARLPTSAPKAAPVSRSLATFDFEQQVRPDLAFDEHRRGPGANDRTKLRTARRWGIQRRVLVNRARGQAAGHHLRGGSRAAGGHEYGRHPAAFRGPARPARASATTLADADAVQPEQRAGRALRAEDSRPHRSARRLAPILLAEADASRKPKSQRRCRLGAVDELVRRAIRAERRTSMRSRWICSRVRASARRALSSRDCQSRRVCLEGLARPRVVGRPERAVDDQARPGRTAAAASRRPSFSGPGTGSRQAPSDRPGIERRLASWIGPTWSVSRGPRGPSGVSSMTPPAPDHAHRRAKSRRAALVQAAIRAWRPVDPRIVGIS